MGGVLGFWGLGGDCIREGTEVGGGSSIFLYLRVPKTDLTFQGSFQGGFHHLRFRVWGFEVE